MNVAMVLQLAVLRVVPNCCREKERERERERVKCGEWENDLIGDEVEEDKVEDSDDARNFGVLVCRLIFGYNSMMEANLLKEKGHVRD